MLAILSSIMKIFHTFSVTILTIVFCVSLFFDRPLLATAQSEEPASQQRAFVVATVSVFDATLTPVPEKPNTYTVSFSLYNSTGVQSDILYAIALNSSNGSVTYWRGSQSISLGQGERKLFAKEVTIPDYMLGSTVQFVVLAKTKSDLPLGNHAFEKITTSGTPSGLLLGDCSVTPRNATTSYTHNQGVDVHPQETILATCPVQNFSKKTITLHSVDLEVRRRSIFGDILEQKTIPLKESITLDANKKGSFSFTINPLDTPQAYHVLVSPA